MQHAATDDLSSLDVFVRDEASEHHAKPHLSDLVPCPFLPFLFPSRILPGDTDPPIGLLPPLLSPFHARVRIPPQNPITNIVDEACVPTPTNPDLPPPPSPLTNKTGEAASDEGGEAGNDDDDDDDDPEAKASYTRQRRLSHVRTAIHKENEGASDVGMVPAVPVTELLKQCAEEGPPAADLLVACATRAVDEPGYRKTNQDSYAVHEKFASTAGSFFAVFDGHGPNGGEGRACPCLCATTT